MILVTGGTGFIGSHLVKHLTEKGDQVVSLVHDLKTSKWLDDALKGSIKVRGDIRDFHFLRRVLNEYEVSQVYHMAALSLVKHAWKDPVNTFDINVLGTVKLLQVSRELQIPKILVQSTDKVYGNQLNATVNSPLKPTEPYGSSKIACDLVAQTFIKTYNMNIVIARSCNVYGFDTNNRIIPNTIRACLKGESPVIFKNDTSKRQYIYISDLVDCLTCLMSGNYKGVFNIATNSIMSPTEVVFEVLKHFPGLKPRYVDKPKLKEIKSQSMKTEPNLIGKTPFSRGIKKTIEAFRKYKCGQQELLRFG